MIKVSATEFQRNFGRIQQQVRESQEPVLVTWRGREAFVLMPAKEYRRLKARDRRAFYARELPREFIEAIRRVKMNPRHERLNKELE